MLEEGKVRWGDKSPVNVTVAHRIFRHFPNARFIHVIRDGRDVVCSLRTHGPSFKKLRTRERQTNEWQLCVGKWHTWVRSGIRWRGDDRYYELRYETLIERPVETLQNLCAWLGESWDPELVERAKQTHVKSHPGVSRPLSDRGRGRWQRDLPVHARRLFAGRAGELLIELGYADSDNWMGAAARLVRSPAASEVGK